MVYRITTSLWYSLNIPFLSISYVIFYLQFFSEISEGWSTPPDICDALKSKIKKEFYNNRSTTLRFRNKSAFSNIEILTGMWLCHLHCPDWKTNLLNARPFGLTTKTRNGFNISWQRDGQIFAFLWSEIFMNSQLLKLCHELAFLNSAISTK
jgi:hypothetical protein